MLYVFGPKFQFTDKQETVKKISFQCTEEHVNYYYYYIYFTLNSRLNIFKQWIIHKNTYE